MSFINFLRSQISEKSPIRFFYYKLVAAAAAIRFGFPARKMKVIAVTGTKGKSTTCHFVASILQAAGFRVGMATTIQFQIGDRIIPNATKQTTQGRFDLQRWISKMAKAKCDFAVLEVTSHALVQSRFLGVHVNTAVLTNIDRDHLEYHGGFDEYRAAKTLLFKKPHDISVLPIDDPQFPHFKKISALRTITFGNKAEISALHIKTAPDASNFTLQTPHGNIEIHLHIPGDFNIKNALAAAAACLSFNVPLSAIKKGLEHVKNIPGRMEEVHAGQKFRVVVDYAHTEDSLKKLLSFYKPQTKGKLIVVFGCTGGGRDTSKRPSMGKIADQFADVIILTDDDPYTEDRWHIIEQIAEGISRKESEIFHKIPNRRDAIGLALRLAKEHDTVLIAGKGCEPIQIIGNEKIPWDDREVVRKTLNPKP